MAEVRIRTVEPNDTSAISTIYAQAVCDDTATFELDAPSTAEMAHRIEKILKEGHHFLVGEIDGTVCGYAYASTFRL